MRGILTYHVPDFSSFAGFHSPLPSVFAARFSSSLHRFSLWKLPHFAALRATRTAKKSARGTSEISFQPQCFVRRPIISSISIITSVARSSLVFSPDPCAALEAMTWIDPTTAPRPHFLNAGRSISKLTLSSKLTTSQVEIKCCSFGVSLISLPLHFPLSLYFVFCKKEAS